MDEIGPRTAHKNNESFSLTLNSKAYNLKLEREIMATKRTEQVNIRITPVLKKKLVRLSKADHRKLAGYIVATLERHVDTCNAG